MKTNNTNITNIISALKHGNEDYVRNSGLGYCADSSIELIKQLEKIGVVGKLIYGKYLSQNKSGLTAKAHFKKLIENFPTGKSFHGRVKTQFIKNGNKLSDKGGHVGVLVDDTVYDVTSAQFGLPISYPLDIFLGMWDNVHVVDITLKPNKTSWNQKIQYTYKNDKKKEISMENINSSLGVDMSLEDKDTQDFLDWFSIQSKQVKYNSKIVSAEELGMGHMLHIDKTTPGKFIPMLPRSAGPSEDNTTPRITVAPSLIGCMIGYARAETDFIEGTSKTAIERTGFKGGYEICELPFKHCLAPNKELVYDAERSHEHWLVSYNKETLEYIPIKVGKMFISKVSYEAVNDNLPKVVFEIYIEINKEEGIDFSPTLKLSKGYHKACIYFDRKDNKGSADDENNFTVLQITGADYNNAKQLSAALLSYKEPKPKFINW